MAQHESAGAVLAARGRARLRTTGGSAAARRGAERAAGRRAVALQRFERVGRAGGLEAAGIAQPGLAAAIAGSVSTQRHQARAWQVAHCVSASAHVERAPSCARRRWRSCRCPASAGHRVLRARRRAARPTPRSEVPRSRTARAAAPARCRRAAGCRCRAIGARESGGATGCEWSLLRACRLGTTTPSHQSVGWLASELVIHSL